ncbi:MULTISPECIES: peptidylprolyl isomerase [Acetobacterium]|jgi:peptidyl-prolyl cis-trans isomerase C|uniref:Foldase n=1 Tax=Acetobacterium wieringae TaxID=52694 RepID=A0A1F2PIV1_9FIRM|nr:MULTISPECIES: peptidylprolyl isomerase [Acetobacterium]MEA4805192.1 peptidylprolyl isomerase [Acetobacterium wieringae]OFV70646.1 putative peptidyl-prolyl cis-trans isomerase Cbf2 precursor [Acetobacterium wieringae]TYC88308.1 foldase [Acetobacterium wieringae]URN83076.1 peptidylprolyl isomerase [Acetobacterium wieringae]
MEKTPLATVNGKTIYSADLDALIRQLPQEQANQFTSKEGRRQLLEELIAQELFYLEGKAAKVDESEEFQKMLIDAEEKLLKTHMIAKFMMDITVPDEEVQKFYDENPNQFIAPDSIRASHILLPTEEQAVTVIEEIKNGKSFAAAAKEYSMCPSNEKGGDLSYFSKGQMVPEFESAAFALEIDEMTELPVQTQFGFHIIKLTDRKIAQTIPFDAVKENARNYLLREKQNKAFIGKVEDLKQKYPVKMEASTL